MSLENLGWNTYLQSNFETYSDKGFIAGRIMTQHKGIYTKQEMRLY
jgi:hypothetical protein